MEKHKMKEIKNTIDLENFLVNDLKSDEEIKLYLNKNPFRYSDSQWLE